MANESWLFHNRIVEMVDCWTVMMADTDENQEEHPQMSGQKPGCGIPIARMIGVFSLATGAINHIAIGPYQGKQSGETPLLRTIFDRILPGRILLADRYYASFWLLAAGEMQAIEELASSLRLGSRRRDEQWDSVLEIISELIVGNRPGRQEKRELKRRQKNDRLMTCPRNPNRNRYAIAA